MIPILGGGLAGLTAGSVLAGAGKRTVLIEKEGAVGGLSRTIRCGRYGFDLGGHRFLTYNRELEDQVKRLLGDDLLRVGRRSQIYLRGRYVDYPLTPVNAVRKLGLPSIAAILADYGQEKARRFLVPRRMASLEDWVVANFGRTLFDLYFREYSEKVWGLECSRISSEWVAQRIDNLSLLKTLRHAFFRVSGRGVKTLTDQFLYPRYGIGQLAEKLQQEIERSDQVLTTTEVERICHQDGRIKSIHLQGAGARRLVDIDHCISSLPLTVLLRKLHPAPPAFVLAEADKIDFRALVLVVLFLDRKRVTDLTWLYLPEKEIPFGRIHEPKNWSPSLAPADKTHLVAEFFCQTGDATWAASDRELTDLTAGHLARLGFFKKEEVAGSRVLRIPHAYPIFDLEYRQHLQVVTDYLATLKNLHLVGRSGTFSYLNMDKAMESGMLTARRLLEPERIEVRSPERPVPLSSPSWQPARSQP